MLTASPLDVSPSHLKKPRIRRSPTTNTQDPKDIALDWLDRFVNVLSHGNLAQLADVFHKDSWWRDHLALDWDLHTVRGVTNISSYLSTHLPKAHMKPLALVETGKYAPSKASPMEGLEWIQSMFNFSTAAGNGKGMFRLVQSDEGVYKAHMLYTALQDLHNHPEAAGPLRPHGGKNSLDGGIIRGNWLERRQRQLDFLDSEPQALVIGAGQAGLNISARLQALGMSCLIIDRNKRIGDNWRNRYRTLVTHDVVTYTHMAYLPFPQTWPLYTPKDKLGDWFEAYASVMELNVWTSTSIEGAEYEDAGRRWTVRLAREDGTERTLHPHHVVLATGHSGEPLMPSIPGQHGFQGTVYHGSQHQDASSQPSVAGKRVVVVGTGNSGHDIAQNFCEHGASVTMLQRRGTYVLQAEKGGLMLHAGTYDESGPPTEDADVYSQSLPLSVQFALGVGTTARIAEAERESIEGLQRAGFKLDFGADGSGLFKKYMTRGGGYYIDVGASQLIIDGKIKVVQSPDGIKEFERDSLVLADGRKLEADIVVLATGYDNMRTSLRKIMGDQVADRAKDVWDVDDAGELNAMWRPSGHPRLWYMGGNLALCRIYSKFLALQIKAIEEGINDA